MNSKERVLAALEGRVPDQVPIGEFAVDFDTVETIIGHETYLRAKAKSQIAFWEGRHDEVAESYLEDHIELHQKLALDIVTFPMMTWEIPAARRALSNDSSRFLAVPTPRVKKTYFGIMLVHQRGIASSTLPPY